MKKVFPLGNAIGNKFFASKTSPVGGGYAYDPGQTRYVPKGLDSGMGWGVFDRQQDRFLEDHEVRQLSEDALMNAQLWLFN